MKNVLLMSLLFSCLASSATAQSDFPADRSWGAVDIFYTASSTDVTTNTVRMSDQLNAGGLNIVFTQRRFSGDFRYEHDFSSIPGLLGRAFDVNEVDFSRDCFELGAAYALTPSVDVQAGTRNERITFDPSIRSSDVEFVALSAGIGFHSPRDRAVGIEGRIRVYYGGTALDRGRITDTNGYRAEVRIPIKVFSTEFRIIPGASFDRIRTDRQSLELSKRSYTIAFGLSGFDQTRSDGRSR